MRRSHSTSSLPVGAAIYGAVVLGVLALGLALSAAGGRPGPDPGTAPQATTPESEVDGASDPRGWLGIRAGASTPSRHDHAGVAVDHVVPARAADRGGIVADDVIVALGSRTTPDRAALIGELDRLKPGFATTVTLCRQGRHFSERVVLDSLEEVASYVLAQRLADSTPTN